jgi:hypothetical protein
MYRNVFRGSLAHGLETDKSVCICEKKAALKRSPGVDKRPAEEVMKSKTVAGSKSIRGATKTNVDV